jgi:hypothetical protein
MTDYTRGTGSSATMMIRDTNPGGSSGNVEFWLNSNNSSTFDHDLPWSYTIDGYAYPGYHEHNYNANSGWNLISSWNITYSQTVNFRIGATGTSGFGGPTSFDQWIQRATAPAAPSTPTFPAVGPTEVTVAWTPNSDGGAAIDNYNIGWGLTSGGATSFVTSTTSPKVVAGLSPGVTYWFWVQAHNSVGWGGWSASSTVTTIAGARIKVAGVWVFAVPYVKDAGVWKLAKPYVKDAGVWKEAI